MTLISSPITLLIVTTWLTFVVKVGLVVRSSLLLVSILSNGRRRGSKNRIEVSMYKVSLKNIVH